MTDDDALWKRRFLIFTFVRLSALLLVLAGLGIAAGDIVRPGGWRAGGLALVLLGVGEMLFVPRLLRKGWENK